MQYFPSVVKKTPLPLLVITMLTFQDYFRTKDTLNVVGVFIFISTGKASTLPVKKMCAFVSFHMSILEYFVCFTFTLTVKLKFLLDQLLAFTVFTQLLQTLIYSGVICAGLYAFPETIFHNTYFNRISFLLFIYGLDYLFDMCSQFKKLYEHFTT